MEASSRPGRSSSETTMNRPSTPRLTSSRTSSVSFDLLPSELVISSRYPRSRHRSSRFLAKDEKNLDSMLGTTSPSVWECCVTRLRAIWLGM